MDKKNRLGTILALLLFIFFGVNAFSDITIDADFENGHLGKYKIIQPDTISVGPVSGHRDLWFSFKIKGVKHKKISIVFEMKNKEKLGANFGGVVNNTAMVTYDGKGFEIIKDVGFSFKIPGVTSGNYIQKLTHVFREDEALVSYCAPWSNTRMAELAEKLKSDKRVQIDSIGKSKFKNLPLTYFKVTDSSSPDKTKKKLFYLAREDSYEAGGSWAVEGILKFILSEDAVAKEMLKKMVFYIFPVFSVDGVAIGSTNYPLDPENNDYVYVTATWDKEPPYYEVKLMKDFWNKLKRTGEEIDIGFRAHATCYWQCHFRLENCSKENKSKSQELFRILKNNLSWRIDAGSRENSETKTRMTYQLQQVFPNALTYSSHNDFVFTQDYLKTDKPVIRRHEDVIQDGELIARCFAEFYGIQSKEIAPYLMAGDIDKNCGKKGNSVTYSVYYYDINEIPPAKIEVIINGKPYKMTCENKVDYKKPVKYTYKSILNEPLNDYYFTASNGKKERKIPEDDYLLPGPFIIQ